MTSFYCCGFQDFKFEHYYDCIWLQWFLMYLTDEDLIKALKESAKFLTVDPESGDSGLIIIKENVKSRDFYVDKSDNSVIRSPQYFLKIFDAAGLEVLHSSYQPGWPKDLYEIVLWVLRKKNVK